MGSEFVIEATSLQFSFPRKPIIDSLAGRCLNEQRGELNRKDVALIKLQSDLKQRETELATWTSSLVDREDAVIERESAVDEREAAVTTREEALVAECAKLQSIKSGLAELLKDRRVLE